MELCDSDHEQICYDSVNCPLCEATDKNNDLESEIEELKGKVSELQAEVDELTSPE